jgi:multidrug transporter EmrE-like cation transporter
MKSLWLEIGALAIACVGISMLDIKNLSDIMAIILIVVGTIIHCDNT